MALGPFVSNHHIVTSSASKMMDFDHILDIASQNQGLGTIPTKRYSLQAAPPKKDPRSKGVNPAAIQALLSKQVSNAKKKEVAFKKQREELLAKRVELKSDRKARAMASRTKDNFRGYNGIPVVDVPKKRRTKLEMEQDRVMDEERFRNNSIDPEDDEDNYEYEQTDSEPEEDPEPLRAGKSTSYGSSGSSGKPSSKKPAAGPPKPAQPSLKFEDLMKLAEKKQYEPVELKPKVVRKEERLRTADEIRELEMERKAKKQCKDVDLNIKREREQKCQSTSGSLRKGTSEREQKSSKPQKSSSERQPLPSSSFKKSSQLPNSDKAYSSSKLSVSNRDRTHVSQNDKARAKTSLSGPSGAVHSKVPVRSTSSQSSARPSGVMSANHRSSTSSDLSFKKEAPSFPQGRMSSISGTRPAAVAGQKSQQKNPQQMRPGQGSSAKQNPQVQGQRSGKGEPLRHGSNSVVKSSSVSMGRPSVGGPSKTGNHLQMRPGAAHHVNASGVPQARPGGRGMQGQPGVSGPRPAGIGPGRPGSGGPVPGRPGGNVASGPERPKCTVVSETISSKNVGGPRPGVPPRPGMPQRPGMPPRPGMGPRPMMNRPPAPMLPPITSAYKRKYEDEDEYDSEMDDFIDDGEEDQDEISKHIKEIFGYDRNRYKDESDYALKFMESSWKDMQKEEAQSLRLAVKEDLEEERKEEEERKRIIKKKKKN